MALSPWDVIIIGQGLAGTTLAWHLLEAGQRVLILDRDEPVTSSKIAAGLITPITGQRLALSWRYDEFLAAASKFYTSIEKRTHQKFFHNHTAIRLFKWDAERKNWSQRSALPAYRTHLVEPVPSPLLDAKLVHTNGDGFAMHCAQLDVAAYLEASREILACKQLMIDWQRDVIFREKDVSVCGHVARFVISCEGYAATGNPHFSNVPFTAAKGDILTVRFHRPVPRLCLHHGIWVAPSCDPLVFRVGSSYDRNVLDQNPSAQARADIEEKLKAFISVPYSVLDHYAAVRPIIHESKPIIGFHPEKKQLGFFNGLGSKGSLLAPWFAKCFSDYMFNKTPIPKTFDLRKFF